MSPPTTTTTPRTLAEQIADIDEQLVNLEAQRVRLVAEKDRAEDVMRFAKQDRGYRAWLREREKRGAV